MGWGGVGVGVWGCVGVCGCGCVWGGVGVGVSGVGWGLGGWWGWGLVKALTSIIFHGSFSSLARTFIALRSRTCSIMEVLSR